MSRIKNRLRGSEESLASADDSIDETRSVMSFILSRLPEHASASGIAAAGAVPALSTGGSPSPLAEGSSGDGDGTTLSLPAPYPVEVRKLQWTAVAAHLPGLLKLLLLLAAHALLVVAFLDTGWDHKARRQARAKTLYKQHHHDRLTVCVDAASYPHKPAYAVSVVSHQLRYTTAATILARTSLESEETAIALAISTTAAEVILSDSNTAIRNYSKGRVHEPEPWCQGSGFLLLLLAMLDAWLLCGLCVRWMPSKKVAAMKERTRKRALWLSERKWIGRTAWTVVWLAVLLFVAINSRLHRPRVTACFGMLLLVGFGYVFSKNRNKVKWRPVLSGFLLQFVLGLLLVRWKVGRGALLCVADKMNAAIAFAGHGARFVFGYLATGQLDGDGLPQQNAGLTMRNVLSAVVFFGLLVSLLCHYGLLQCLALKVGRLMAVVMGTTICESFCAASNVFLGMADSVLLIKPCLAQLTRSEIHCVMTCGFATISGSLFAVFTTFGVKAEDMIAASLMSAPAALGFSKLFYPETEESCAGLEKISDPRKSRPGCTLLESVSHGLSAQLRVAAHVVASLLGFLSCMALADSLLAYLGSLVGWQFVTLNWLLGRLFVPLALAMGVGLHECSRVASLLGLKAALNEVVAYGQMGELARGGLLSLRSQLLCAHALCGFSSLGALGVQLGAYAALAPERLSDCARVAGRALVAGSLACFMTACTAGALTDTAGYDVPTAFNSYDFV
ncbi:LOW QUALITY PROTEIN: solute carrier family 28 member 3 [Dermacentor silvarum]|uniref:LOW QUALITY PROTEIN: solute carrier family 28 member 3 n=1 Tax=Dermacentor silvarum TaxID=543639 RepID=UPI002101D0FA|nr:LOW QUALITY PROTEIN: solute carrier family 28 member 3 [Dermacentor silvarum]